MSKDQRKKASKKAALLGIFTTLAFCFSYIEFLIPFDSLGVPGVKLGLANLAVMAALYVIGIKEAFYVSYVRILLSFFIFGSLTALFYSFLGGTVSLCGMIFFKKRDFFTKIGVSVIGGVLHNVGQICAAVILMRSVFLFSYLPVLLVSGVITGALNGALLTVILKRTNIIQGK